MLAPGSKGWIKKYFDLVERNEIRLRGDLPAKIDQDEFIHAALGRTGVIFGYPTRLLFAKDLDDSKWTTEEKLKVLLFESHLFLYKVHHEEEHRINQEDFISALIGFYGHHNGSSVTKVFNFFRKESPEEMIEDILTRRVDIKFNYLENSFWVNYLNNVLIYLDIILFNSYLKHRKKSTFFNYDELALNALTAITLAAFSDGHIEKNERTMFSVFLASANLSDLQREIAEERFEQGAEFSDFSDCLKDNWIYRRFLLDLSTFVIFSNHEASEEERNYLNQFCTYLEFSDLELNEALALTEQFIINNQDKIPFLENKSSIEKVYGSLSKRWIKILGRNKDKLVTEINQSKELVQLIRKSTKTELTKEEKEAVKTQFLDIVKSMPSLAIFMLPGGTVLLPIILKIIPDLMPSAFKDNEVEK
jgi:DnaJ-domain-containing protein 1